MFQRKFVPSERSFFLFGPRATGKTTWLKNRYPAKDSLLFINLLKTNEYLQYTTEPEELRRKIADFKPKRVIIDEIQRVPELLNEIQDLIQENQSKIQFILTGSSARKLKKIHANLLASRASNLSFFPLVSAEVGVDSIRIEPVLKYGLLPEVWNSSKDEDKIEILMAYADLYLREEILQESLVRKLEPFLRFLKIAALMNGQVLNLSEIASQAQVKRPTAEGYFQIITDTLVGFTLPAWQPRIKIKEKANPKFYFFDPGVVRALSGRIDFPLDSFEKGFLFETYLLAEMRAYRSYQKKKGELYYWGTPHGNEIDCIYVHQKSVGFEFKCSKRWRSEFSSTLIEFLNEKHLSRAIGVYLGDEKIMQSQVEIYPLAHFLKKLWEGEFF